MGWRNFGWILLMAALWGPSFLFIKLAVTEIPPFTLVTGRVGIAALFLYLILRWQGQHLPKFGPVWRHFAVMGFFQSAFPFFLFSWGELHIDSALAAILNGTTPLFTILMAHIFIADDRITINKLIGVIIGFGGLVMLVAPSLLEGVQASTLGLLAVTLASCSYGVGLVYARLNLREHVSLSTPAAHLLMATLYMLPLSLLIEQPYNLPMPSLTALGSMLALAIFGTAVAFAIFYQVLRRTSATYVSMVTYLVPIIGVILGVVILSEPLTWSAYAGCALILLGVMVVNGVFNQVLPWVQRQPAIAKSS